MHFYHIAGGYVKPKRRKKSAVLAAAADPTAGAEMRRAAPALGERESGS